MVWPLRNLRSLRNASELCSYQSRASHARSRTAGLMTLTAAGMVCFLWGSGWLLIKLGLSSFPPLFFAGLRGTISGGILISITAWRRRDWPERSQLRAIAGVGFLMMGVSNGLTFWGQQYVPASLAALLFCTMPFFAAALSCLLLRGERFTFGILIGLPMGFCGVWLALSGRLYGVSASSGLGTLSIIGAAMTWALGIVFSKRLLARTSTVLISGIQLIVGSVPLLLVSWLWGEAWSEIIVSRESIAVMLVMIFAQGCVAYILYYWVMSRVGPTILALTSFVSPSIAVVLGVVLLGEQGGWELVVGLITIGLAIGIVNLLTHPVADHG